MKLFADKTWKKMHLLNLHNNVNGLMVITIDGRL